MHRILKNHMAFLKFIFNDIYFRFLSYIFYDAFARQAFLFKKLRTQNEKSFASYKYVLCSIRWKVCVLQRTTGVYSRIIIKVKNRKEICNYRKLHKNCVGSRSYYYVNFKKLPTTVWITNIKKHKTTKTWQFLSRFFFK